MKTLVIHPEDSTTIFLKEIYKNKNNWTIIDNPDMKREEIIKAIQSHDRIIMCGHGSGSGLFGGWFGYLINDSIVPFLKKKKEIICIWCNADIFVKKHNLEPILYTGMFISDVYEASCMGIDGMLEEDIDDSNYLFAESINYRIDEDNFFDNIVYDYNLDDPVVSYNRDRLFHG